MKSLDDLGSLDELKQAIAHLTQKYESLRNEERAGKLAEAREIVATYQITAEELGFKQTVSRAESATEKRATKRVAPDEPVSQPIRSPQQPLW